MWPLRNREPVVAAPPISGRTLPDGFKPRDARHLTILLVARLVTPAGDALARVRNISNGGMMLETSLPLAIGEAVRLELRTLRAVEGLVVWTTPPRAGVRFDTPADVAQLLHAATPNGRVARAPRLATRCPVQLRHDGRTCRAMLLDLSQGGGHVRVPRPVAVGDPVTLSIPEIGARNAVVRWVRGDEAGLVFLDAIPFAALEPWFQNHLIRFAGQTPAE